MAFVSSPSVWSLLDSNSSQGSLCDWELGCLEDSWWVLLLYPGTPTWKIKTGFPESSFSVLPYYWSCKSIKKAVFHSNVHLKVSCMFIVVSISTCKTNKIKKVLHRIIQITLSEVWGVGSKSLEHSLKFRFEKWIIAIPLK